MNYHLGVQGVQSGPFSEQVIREKIARGELPSGTMCWAEGWSEWRPLTTVFPTEGVSPPPPLPPAGFHAAPSSTVPTYKGPTETSGLAITSLVTGVFGLLIFFPAVAAVVCGHIACSNIKASAGRVTGRGMAITGLVLGYLTIGLIPVGLLAAMAIPAFNKVRVSTQEKIIQNNLRMLSAAADQYMLENGAISASYADLVGPNKYIKELAPVMGEDYTRIVIRSTDTAITVTVAGGREISHPRYYVSDAQSF